MNRRRQRTTSKCRGRGQCGYCCRTTAALIDYLHFGLSALLCGGDRDKNTATRGKKRRRADKRSGDNGARISQLGPRFTSSPRPRVITNASQRERGDRARTLPLVPLSRPPLPIRTRVCVCCCAGVSTVWPPCSRGQ